ncbi:Rz1-like lysis system protein LysC [Escherichia coli]|uniref:Rz1-like lysis system protein LysC n=1 Tax=Escherichia coli TaxID=562 RepID=UPI003D715F12
MISLFLLILLSGCSTTRTVYAPAHCTPIPGTLTQTGDRATTTRTLTYCQAVLWINPLLAAIEKANNQLAGVRQIEQSR